MNPDPTCLPRYSHSYLETSMTTMMTHRCDHCGDAKTHCPNCGCDVHLDELLGTGCILCKKYNKARYNPIQEEDNDMA